MNKANLSKLNSRFLHGDSLSNKELNTLVDLYTATTEALDVLGCQFHIAWKESHYRLLTLQSYKSAREER